MHRRPAGRTSGSAAMRYAGSTRWPPMRFAASARRPPPVGCRLPAWCSWQKIP